ncbi:dTDP-4-dehydrorhamnose reductase [Synechococcus sp. RedBA-s]|uniref:dTDP-4-dehydrorhamnose reductase n=1 Tax=Synechococcus sp. RedBA-s TaxID=2823741 RepID=UPI0020CFA01A|nr:dTDP-4-dehydrorhamnose reductase [Synechococcus sp. RedBA-s]MCP9799441.1 dTDP-4-dehydrorhamnose reductase [Synechococcus sp. RedBA-s]
MSSHSPLLVIGRSGQVASALRRLAPQLLPDRPLVVVTRPELDLAASTGELSLTLEQLLCQHQPALVLNAAAYTAVDKAEIEPELASAINATAVGVLAHACAERSLPLFHLSTDYVFAGSGERPWWEDDPTGPLGVYGASKLAGEQALQAAGGQHLLLRVSWVFGLEGANFVRTMLRLGAERPALSVVADQVGGPTSAEAIASTWLSLADAAMSNSSPLDPAQPFPWGIYHYAGQPAVSWHGFAEAIFSEAVALGLLPHAPQLTAIPSSAYPNPARRPANSRLDTSRFRAAFGLPLPQWREDLRRCLHSWA